jgi:hypothetical protein
VQIKESDNPTRVAVAVRRKETVMTKHIGYIHGSKLEPFSPPSFCRSGAGLQQYTYYYQKGYRQVTGRPCPVEDRNFERLSA